MSKYYVFNMEVGGWAESPEEAWQVVQENFNPEEEPMPNDYYIEDEDDE